MIRSSFAQRVLFTVLLCCGAWSHAQPGADAQSTIDRAGALRRTGHVQEAASVLVEALQATRADADKARLRGELGATLLQARRHDEAQVHLDHAIATLQGQDRATYGVYRGNVLVLRRKPQEARAAYADAMEAARRGSDVWMSAAANHARLLPPAAALRELDRLAGELQAIDPAARVRHHLQLGEQARLLGRPGLELAWRQLSAAGDLARSTGDTRAGLEAADSLAQLYEDNGRSRDAFVLSRQALASASGKDQPLLADVLVPLEWRSARHLARSGDAAGELAALSRAVDLVRSIRADMPIESESGKSVYRETLEPLYLSYADALLRAADRQPGARQEGLRRVLDVVEELKQSELQDYLGDRCAVEEVQGGSVAELPAGVAAIYTLVFADRVELLMRAADGVTRRTVPARGDAVRAAAARFARDLRDGAAGYEPAARQLYDWLVRPLERDLVERAIHSLVIVPDAALRVLPFAALMDADRFVLEQYAVSTVTGLSLTNSAAAARRSFSALVVGVSEPGPVVDKLAGSPEAAALLGSAAPVTAMAAHTGRNLRSIGDAAAVLRARTATGAVITGTDALRERLRLPGVDKEVAELRALMPGKALLNSQFTLRRFAAEAESSEYRILHIASHGVFGGSSQASFILAHDDLLTIEGLQSILRSESLARAPIRVARVVRLRDGRGQRPRAPRFSGAAVKARAKSVLGSLWPVDDDAAQQVMKDLYGGIVRGRLSKTEALRRAQLGLLRAADTRHPVFWAPFLIVGNWS